MLLPDNNACQVSNIDVGKTKEAFQLTQLQLVVPDAMPVSVLTRHGRSLVATSKSLTHKATLCMDQSDTDHLEVCCALASSPQSRDLSLQHHYVSACRNCCVYGIGHYARTVYSCSSGSDEKGR